MDEAFDQENLSVLDREEQKNEYSDLLRLVESGQRRRFEESVRKFDLINFESSTGDDRPSKSLLLKAIELNSEKFVEILLEMEVPIEEKYSVMIENSNGEFVKKTVDALALCKELKRENLSKLVEKNIQIESISFRLQKIVGKNSIEILENFLRKFRNDRREKFYSIEAFFLAAQLGSVRILDFFLSKMKLDVNLSKNDGETKTTPLLTAITFNQGQAAKFLLFRAADPNKKGQFDNALVTALHFNASDEIVRLLLEKNADPTVRHPDFPKLTLRQFCILTNRVSQKKQLDSYVASLVAKGNFHRLNWMVEHGYPHIFVYFAPHRNTKQLAQERYFDKIVKLIDEVVERETRAKIKMNY